MPNNHSIDVTRGTARLANEPGVRDIRNWLLVALEYLAAGPSSVSVRVVSAGAMTRLNWQYRHKHNLPNVLSFEAGFQDESGLTFLGDLVVCNRVILEESQRYGRSFDSRYAHLLVHGLLHLTGQDHASPASRDVMEDHETQILAQLGFSNPY